MRRLFHILLTCWLWALGGAAAHAQESDKDWLTRTIQDALSGAGRTVSIDGFRGALSSEASFERLTIADEEGVWLTLTDVTLDWTRTALLRGRLEVEKLTARQLDLPRSPKASETETLPDAEAKPFSLPDLPVSINIAEFAVDQINLGAPFLGEPVQLNIKASAQLSDEQGNVDFVARRIDTSAGVFEIKASLNRSDAVLDLLLNLSEQEGGIAARVLNLPGAPSVDLRVAGKGPIDEFASQVRLATDGQPRLEGPITIAAQPSRRNAPTPDRRVVADIRGDITALLAPRFRDFFGTDVGLKIDTLIESSGAIEVSDFALKSRAADLRGQVSVNQESWPTFIDITGRIANPEGTPTLLPVGGEGTTVEQVDLRVAYDAANGEAFSAAFDLSAFSMADIEIAQARLGFEGTLQGNLGSVGQFLGDLEFVAEGLALRDAARAEALGQRLTGRANINYIEGQPIRISDLDLAGTDYGLTGKVIVNGVEQGLLTRLDAVLRADDLSRFSALAGREIDGRTDLALKGTITPLSGAFDLDTRGSTQDLRIGIAQADAVMQGRTELTLQAVRNETGTFLQDVVLRNPSLSLTGRAALRTGQSDLAAQFALRDVALVVPQYAGPVEVTATAQQDDQGWRVDARTSGPYDAVLTLNGLATGPEASLRFSADVAEVEPFARPFVPDLNERLSGPVTAKGTLRQSPEGWLLQSDARGPFDLSAQLEGLVSPAMDLGFALDVPSVTPLVAGVEGPLQAQGRLRQNAEGFEITTSASGPYGALAEVSGALTPVLSLRYQLDVPQVQQLVPQLEGALSAQGTLDQTEAGLRVEALASGPHAAQAQVAGALSPALDLQFDLGVPDLAPIVPQAKGALSAQGRLQQSAGALRVQARAQGPYAAQLRAEGAVSPAFDLEFDLSLPEVSAIVPQATGPLSAEGRLQQVDGAFVVQSTALGPFASQAQVEGALSPALDLRFDLSVPNLRPVVPQLDGPLAAQGRVRQQGQGFFIDTSARGPFGARAVVEGLATGPDMRLTFDASVPNVNPLVPGVSGPLAAKGVVRQTPAGIALDTNATGPYASRANLRGVVTGPEAAVSYTVAMPNIGVLVDRVNGPLDLSGTARKAGSAWRLETDARGPSGTQANLSGLVSGDGTLALDIRGSAPLGLSRPFIAPRNLQGQARFDLAVNGPPALSSLSGRIETSNAALSAPNLRLALTDIAGAVTLGNTRAVLNITGAASNGGQVQIGGGVTLTPPLPADISIGLQRIVLIDPRLYRTDVSGQLRITGPLSAGARIAGQINVGETNVNVPSTGLTSIGEIPPITHVGASSQVQSTRRRAGLTEAQAGNDPAGTASGPGFPLDLQVNAPNRIFVRGRGLDAELGGGLALTGNTNNIISAGRFELIRGRLDILGKRFTLREGSIQFEGDLIPYLRFVSATPTTAGEVRVIVEGRADAPEVTFESTPEAPQDEVLAQLLFGRNISEISAFQAVQLASAVATLAGRGGGGIISNLREGFGLDDLDVTTTEDGATALRLGKYLSENVYTDVTATSDGSAEVSLNLDISPNLTGKATLGSDGESSIGIFFEKDY